ncbi:MAG: hypothetical protein Kow00133_17820 [Amphiplicatus sp.]
MALWVAVAALAGCVGGPPPWAEGARLFDRGDYAGAHEALSPLARQGDPAALYYTARMTLSGVSPAPIPLEQATADLVRAARGGSDEAHGLLLLMAMTLDERAQFGAAKASFSRAFPYRTGSDPQSRQAAVFELLALREPAVLIAEQVAGGPVNGPTVDAMLQLHEDAARWPEASKAVRPADQDFLAIDEARAKAGDKYAQARLANRYAEGRGVERDLKQAFDWRLKAARASAAPRNCVYQAPVGGGSGSVYCYDAGAATAGLPAAKLEICRAYAEGSGVEQNVRAAKKWCERAREHPRYKDEAEKILAALAG